MSTETLSPYTILETARTLAGHLYDQAYLVYGDTKLAINHTEYALLQGEDLEEASEERHALRENKPSKRNSVISHNSAKVVLGGLRKKVEGTFPDLVIPRATTNGIKPEKVIWTKAEIAEIRRRIENPEEGCYVISDERGIRHLFVNKVEINPDRFSPGINKQYLAIALILLFSKNCSGAVCVNPRSDAFWETMRDLTGKDRISDNSLGQHIAYLRAAFKPAGLKLTKKDSRQGYILIPCQQTEEITPTCPVPTPNQSNPFLMAISVGD